MGSVTIVSRHGGRARLSTALRLVALCAVVLAHHGCRNQQTAQVWPWNTERPAGPLQTFSHERHQKALGREKFECFGCHTMSARIEDPKDAADAIRASKAKFIPGKDQCHVCHFNPAAGTTAPDRCDLCHLDVREVQPANHNFDWINRHAVFAKADSVVCEDCHRPRFCEDCHNRRDQPTRAFHDRNFRFVHAIEARANPMRCGECHTPSFCENCHVKGGYER